jgi:hypothetical protein
MPMPASQFNEDLPILFGDDTLRLGVCAMGPIADGHVLEAMRVWVWQVDGEKFAASAGNGGEHPGKHPLAPTEVVPFKLEEGWMIQTQLEPGSPEFSEGKPALAMAMALVKHKDKSTEVLQWNQAVRVHGRRHHEYPEGYEDSDDEHSER